ncbi:MAG TPA: YciI family protein, partial [Bryobacteraceae bacterium]|nr:YciI family protein [Bryobacteraceae bacterium]
HKQGKLVMAGPFMPGPSGDAGDWRGIVVYRVGSVAEAQQLAANDPAAKAGRLAIEARPWMTLKGILK